MLQAFLRLRVDCPFQAADLSVFIDRLQPRVSVVGLQPLRKHLLGLVVITPPAIDVGQIEIRVHGLGIGENVLDQSLLRAELLLFEPLQVGRHRLGRWGGRGRRGTVVQRVVELGPLDRRAGRKRIDLAVGVLIVGMQLLHHLPALDRLGPALVVLEHPRRVFQEIHVLGDRDHRVDQPLGQLQIVQPNCRFRSQPSRPHVPRVVHECVFTQLKGFREFLFRACSPRPQQQRLVLGTDEHADLARVVAELPPLNPAQRLPVNQILHVVAACLLVHGDGIIVVSFECGVVTVREECLGFLQIATFPLLRHRGRLPKSEPWTGSRLSRHRITAEAICQCYASYRGIGTPAEPVRRNPMWRLSHVPQTTTLYCNTFRPGITTCRSSIMIKILRDRGLSDLVGEAELKLLHQGFQFTEGPLAGSDGSLLFQDIKAERTFRISADGTLADLRDQTRAANGQTWLPGGGIVFCEQNGRRLCRMAPDGSDVTALAETWSGGRLNSPNDVVCRSDGLVYFTDPPYGVDPSQRSLHFQGVYVLDLERPGDSGLRLLADDFEKPNGLAFSPDEHTLYVCDTARYHVRAFDVQRSGALEPGSSRVVARMDPGRPGGPDGMKVDRAGRLYVAVALGVWVFEPDGNLLGILPVPERPANLAWCDRRIRGGWPSPPSTRSTKSSCECRASCLPSSSDFFRSKCCSNLNRSIILDTLARNRSHVSLGVALPGPTGALPVQARGMRGDVRHVQTT